MKNGIGKMARLVEIVSVLSVRGVLAAGSGTAVVDCDDGNPRWTTVFTNTVPLTWGWPTDSTHAALAITGMNGTFSTNFVEVTSNVLWHVFATDAPDKEDAYTLTLTFYGSEGIVGALTSQLAVVSGAFRAAAVNALGDDVLWTKVRNKAIIPYRPVFAETATNPATARLVIAKIGGQTQTNAFPSAAGYYGWKLLNNGWGYGTFDLALAFPETGADALTAELFRPLDGTAISVR